MLKYALAFGLAGVFGLWVGAVQEPRCTVDPQRRLAALTYARLLSAEEARFSSQVHRHGSLSELGIRPAPAGFRVQLSLDDTGYTGYMFSIKDTLDACHWALFSDQEGIFYTAQPLN